MNRKVSYGCREYAASKVIMDDLEPKWLRKQKVEIRYKILVNQIYKMMATPKGKSSRAKV